MRDKMLSLSMTVLGLVALLLIALDLTLAGCRTESTPVLEKPVASESPTATPQVTPTPTYSYVPRLAWESNGPDAVGWTYFVTGLLDRELLDVMDKASDIETFCPKYRSLQRPERINFWGELISSVAFYESSWNPASRYHEASMGSDPVTGQPVYSEGLLQLSYQDVRNMPDVLGQGKCGISWSADRGLSPSDPKKTILQPKINLECGLRILAHQIERHGKIVVTGGSIYWSTLSGNPGSKYTKVPQISARTKALGFCQ